MSNYEALRNLLVLGLNQALGILVVEQNPNAPRPAKPYATINAINPLIDEARSVEINQAVPSPDPVWDVDIKVTRYTQPRTTFSLTFCGMTKAQAIDLATQAHDWFVLGGYQTLKDAGVVVAGTEALQDRTIEIVGHWEYRAGFDVHLRTVRALERIEPTIETVEFNKEG